jgi:hypothetical protein
MTENPAIRVFARDVGVDPPVGGQSNVQDALAAGGAGGLTVIRFAFDHTQHATLAAGVLVATLADGDAISVGYPALSTVTAFDGTTPVGNLATTQADAVAGSNLFFGAQNMTIADGNQVNNLFTAVVTTSSLYKAEGGSVPIWFAITDGSGNDPMPNNGAGEVVLVIVS